MLEAFALALGSYDRTVRILEDVTDAALAKEPHRPVEPPPPGCFDGDEVDDHGVAV